MSNQNLESMISIRRDKLSNLRTANKAYPNSFKKDCSLLEAKTKENCSSAGRIITKRFMGKICFATLQDESGTLQIVADLSTENFQEFKTLDIGDIIGFTGNPFKTIAGEDSSKITSFICLTKALRPLPDKWGGISDIETSYRQRYLDLIVNPENRKIFEIRSHIISYIRKFFENQNFIEVETPILMHLVGGANAKPFNTHHNHLDVDLIMRIAPELNLKRLLVGGFENIFEIGKNFRNEGISIRHNPEFTMLEFYQAYKNVNDGIKQTKDLLFNIGNILSEKFSIGNKFVSFREETMLHLVEMETSIDISKITDIEYMRNFALSLNVHYSDNDGCGQILTNIFEVKVEKFLVDPIFVTNFPSEVSPLAKKSANDFFSERFELYVDGFELANGYSELNDPEQQAEYFAKQVASKNDEAMQYDTDYIVALEHGMPPACGVGIGIDRLIQYLTNSKSIRDVILFPTLRQI